MTIKIISEERLDCKPLQLGPRVEADVKRRMRLLEARFKPSPADLRELATLRSFLREGVQP